MSLLRYAAWLLRALLFVLLLLFAVRNTAPVKLQLFMGAGWEVPLIVLLLLFFTLGVALGVAGVLVRVVQQRREIASLRRRLGEAPAPAATPLAPVPPDPGL